MHSARIPASHYLFDCLVGSTVTLPLVIGVKQLHILRVHVGISTTSQRQHQKGVNQFSSSARHALQQFDGGVSWNERPWS